MASKRLMREYKDIKDQKDPEIFLKPSEDNILSWYAMIIGPKDSPFEGGFFEIKITVPSDYPIKPPKALFTTKIFHPNIHFKTGEICLDILKNSWSPAWTIQTVCRAVLSLLNHPEPSSPLNCDAGNLLRCGDDRGYKSMAKMYTKLYATKSNVKVSFD